MLNKHINDSISETLLMVCRQSDAPWSAELCDATTSRPQMSYLTGYRGTPREVGYGDNSWLTLIILLMLVTLAFNFNNCRRLFKNFSQSLLGAGRRRSNAFDDRTANESRTALLITLLLCLNEGILLFTYADASGMIPATVSVFGAVMALTGCALLFYAAQYVIYRIVGYAFTDKFGSDEWLRGFRASQALLGFVLLIPALFALFYPGSETAMVVVAAVAYIAARLTFIYKGFRIFYNNFQSLLYFILYLCALEITPLLFMGRMFICNT